jgi:hypothetical protein
MDAGDWEDLREEVCIQLAVGHESGEPELETITRMLWLERQRYVCLSVALVEAIQAEATAALEHDRRTAGRVSNVLAWKPALRSVGPFCRHL